MRHNQRKDISKILVFLILAVTLISGVFYHVFEIDVTNHLPGYVLCPFRMITHIPCPGCGMTRAMLCLGRLDFGKAIHLNAFSIPLFVVMLVYVRNPGMIRILKNDVILKVLLATVIMLWIFRLGKHFHLMTL